MRSEYDEEGKKNNPFLVDVTGWDFIVEFLESARRDAVGAADALGDVQIGEAEWPSVFAFRSLRKFAGDV